jgi:hypothetical protein
MAPKRELAPPKLAAVIRKARLHTAQKALAEAKERCASSEDINSLAALVVKREIDIAVAAPVEFPSVLSLEDISRRANRFEEKMQKKHGGTGSPNIMP